MNHRNGFDDLAVVSRATPRWDLAQVEPQVLARHLALDQRLDAERCSSLRPPSAAARRARSAASIAALIQVTGASRPTSANAVTRPPEPR